MAYAHDGFQPAPFHLAGNGFSKDVPFAAGLLVDYSASLGAERERPSVEPSREDSRRAHVNTKSEERHRASRMHTRLELWVDAYAKTILSTPVGF